MENQVPNKVTPLLLAWAIIATALAGYFYQRSFKAELQLENGRITIPTPKKWPWGENAPVKPATQPAAERSHDGFVAAMFQQDVTSPTLSQGVQRHGPEHPGVTNYGPREGITDLARNDYGPRPRDGLIDMSFLKAPADRIATAAEQASNSIQQTLPITQKINWFLIAGAVIVTAVIMNIKHTNSLGTRVPR